MKEATLRVWDDTTDLAPQERVYENAYIKEGPIRVSSRLKDDGTIEIGNLEVVLLSETFIGVPDVFSLREEYSGQRTGQEVRYRAVVELNGAAVFDGTIRQTGVATDAADDLGQREWRVEVEDAALSDVMELLKETNIYDYDLLDEYEVAGPEGEPIWSNSETLWPGHIDSSEETLGGEVLRWYSLPDLWRTLIGWLPRVEYATNADGVRNEIVLFPHPIDGSATLPHIISLESLYENEEGDYLFEHTLPEWTGKKLLDVIQNITGMRLSASYEEYPSRNIELREVEGEWRPPEAPLPSLEGRATEDVYDLSTQEPNERDFALWYEGAREDVAGAYAALNPKPFGENDSPVNENTREIALRPALFDNVSYNSSGGETIGFGVPEIREGYAWVSAYAFTEPNPAVDAPMLAHRIVSGDPPNIFNETWLRNHLPRHPLVAAALHQMVGRFDISEIDVQAGLLDRGVYLEGFNWLLRDLRVSKEEGAAKLEAVRPTKNYSPEPERINLFGAPANARIYTTSYRVRGQAQTYYDTKLLWDVPPEPKLAPREYEYEVYSSSGSLLSSGTTTGRTFLIEKASTSPPSPGAYPARVRSQYQIAEGWTSPWLSTTED